MIHVDFITISAQRYGSVAVGGAGLVWRAKPIIAQHTFGRTQVACPLEPVLGAVTDSIAGHIP